ncbi:MAG: ATP-dependent RNA helicase [Phycisphaera sp.]|nr:ATP-dependent RNA helicase [Phycisphaera sp.]
MGSDPRSDPALPVLQLVPGLVDSLKSGRSAIVTAPPGTGKSTGLPVSLLDRLPGRIIVTQPRRLAARMLASHVSRIRGGELGESVGFAVRGERRETAATRLVYVTEGLLLRRMLADPRQSIRDGDVVILDEFHERSIDADLVLGVLLDRGIPHVLASATIDADALATRLGHDPFQVDARLHPVEIEHRRAPSADPCWDLAKEAIRRVLEAPGDDGDILVFMPGRREIDRTVEACRGFARGIDVVPLHGGLPAEAQDRAVAPGGPRRIVVATNIAETSITIPRVTTVVDAGLARVDRFDSERELGRLVTEPIDRAGAIQRAGRAGRLRPGRCIRLYTESEFRRRPEGRTPATSRSDLADAFLRLHAAGIDPETFDWIDRPPETALEHARRTLETIGAVVDNQPTEKGHRLSRLPLPPRIGRFLLDAVDAGGGRFAVAVAAVLAEREISRGVGAGDREALQFPGDPEGDLSWRARLVMASGRGPRGVDPAALVDARRTFADLRRLCRVEDEGDPSTIVRALVGAFADRVAYRRSDQQGSCALPGRKHAMLDRDSVVRSSGFIVAGALRGLETRGDGMTVLSMATVIPPEIAETVLAGRVRDGLRHEFDRERGLMVEVEHRSLDDVEFLVQRRSVGPSSRRAAASELLRLVESGDVAIPGWDAAVESFIERTRRTAGWFPDRGLPAFDEDDLAVMRAEIIGDRTRISDLPGSEAIIEILRSAMDWNAARFVDQMAPTRLSLPGGRGMKLAWKAGEPPRGSARIGDLVGLERTPSVAGGRVPVVLEILAPNRRPVQVTDDLAGFWERSYPAIKKELKRRYPRHPWP